MKLFKLINKDWFKRKNLENWRNNTEFWLTTPLGHVEDLSEALSHVLVGERKSRKSSLNVIDIGCGSAWVANLVENLGGDSQYTGIDFNKSILDRLRSLSVLKDNVSFVEADIELEAPSFLVQKGDVVINAFNLFELTDIESGINNCVALIKPGGIFIVIHIDPISQLISISENWDELIEALQQFEKFDKNLTYDKKISTTIGIEKKREYKGILYKSSDYMKLAFDHNLVLEGFSEVFRCRNQNPQMYQILIWRKPEP